MTLRWYEGLSETPPFYIIDRRPRWLRWLCRALENKP